MRHRLLRLLTRLRLAAFYGPAWVDTLKDIDSLPQEAYQPAEHEITGGA